MDKERLEPVFISIRREMETEREIEEKEAFRTLRELCKN